MATAACLLLLMALVSASSPRAVPLADSWSTMENMQNRANLAAEEAKAEASEAVRDGKATTAGSGWAYWARDKITEGLGLLRESAKVAADRMMETAEDMAAVYKDKIYSAASGAAEMAGEAKAAMMGKAGDARGMAPDGANDAADCAESAHEAAKERVSDAYETAKDTMSEGARANYEAAKEKLSQAAGDVGAEMQEASAEL